jgi:hypothetical protein
MRRIIIVAIVIASACFAACYAQVSGNAAYSQAAGKAAAEQQVKGLRVLTKHELPPTSTTTFVEASVLLNIKADEYVAVFAISQDGATLADCGTKMDAAVKAFTGDLGVLGVSSSDIYVDFIAQNRIYGYELQGDIFQEKVVGFELKKNVSIHYKAADLLDKLTLAAAKAQVFDLVKVDYIVKDLGAIQDKLMDEAARIVKKKMSRYDKLLGVRLQSPAQVYAEKFAVHYPTQMYDSYSAHGSEESPDTGRRDRYAIKPIRKPQTFYLNSLDGDGFDAVINPVITEPVVQCTLYLKMKYDVEQNGTK